MTVVGIAEDCAVADDGVKRVVLQHGHTHHIEAVGRFHALQEAGLLQVLTRQIELRWREIRQCQAGTTSRQVQREASGPAADVEHPSILGYVLL